MVVGATAEEGLVVGTPSTIGVDDDMIVGEGVTETAIFVLEGTTVADDDLIVGEGVTEAAIFVLEGTAVEDDDFEELLLTGTAPVPGAWYISSLYGPPQNSDEFPLQTMLQPETPSGAGPPPPVKALAQSWRSVSMVLRG